MFAAVCFFFPFRNTLVCGQVNVSILFVWTLGVYLLKRQRPMASALCFALGTVLKISPVVAVPFLALRRQWRWLGGLRDGSCCFHRGFHLAIRLADQPDLADGDLPEHFFRAGKYLQPLTRRPRRCAVRSPVFRPPSTAIPNGPFLLD